MCLVDYKKRQTYRKVRTAVGRRVNTKVTIDDALIFAIYANELEEIMKENMKVMIVNRTNDN